MKKREFIRYSTFCGLGMACRPIHLEATRLFNNQHQDDAMKATNSDLVEARYVIETPKGLRCLICPNECTLKEGELSECHNRQVINGKLYTLAYNHLCSVHIDPIEKKPLFHYLPGASALSIGTAGCTFSCLNCQNDEISQVSPADIRTYNYRPQEIVSIALESRCPTLAFTYNEPISFFEYMVDIARISHAKGIKNLLISNGYINEKPLDELIPYIHAANIDLKVFDDLTYQRLTGGTLDPVLAALRRLKDAGVWLEITNLIVPEWTDDPETIEKMCKWLVKNGFQDYPLHFSRFHPAYKLKHLKPTPFKTLLLAKNIALKQGMRFVYVGNVPEYSGENTHCPNCQTELIKRQGFAIVHNRLTNGQCPDCLAKIPGVWSQV